MFCQPPPKFGCIKEFHIVIVFPEEVWLLHIHKVLFEQVASAAEDSLGAVLFVLGHEGRDVVGFRDDIIIADQHEIALHQLRHG